jgi:hypothetical protein
MSQPNANDVYARYVQTLGEAGDCARLIRYGGPTNLNLHSMMRLNW